MMTSFHKRLLVVGAAAIGCGGLVCADAWAGQTYTWLASPADGNWNTTSLYWTINGTDAVAWVNSADDPNNAVFGDSSQKTITVGGTRRIHDLTINKSGYSFQGSSCNMVIYGTMTVDGETHFKGKVSSGADDGALHLTSTKTPVVYFDTGSSKTNDFKCIYIDGTPKFAPNNDNAFGVYPTTPTENIFIVGTPTIFGGAQFSIKANRIIKIASGKNFKTGSNNTFTYKCPIIAENTAGYAYSRDTYVNVVSDWSGLVVFDPGLNTTNAFGKLNVAGRAKLASGVTRVTGAGGTGSSAILYVHGSGSYNSTKGNLLVDGGELYASQGVNVDVSTYGQVTVTNFGKVYMPNVDWLNGSSGCGRLTVAKDGEFTVNLLRISQSSSLSEVHLNEGGLISATLLCTDGNTPRKGKFRFNGGRLRSRTAHTNLVAKTDGVPLTEAQAAGLTFAVGEKGAVFDTELKNLYWNRPLVSDPAAGFDTDGGLHKIGGNILVLTNTNCYNGVTWIEGGDAQLRVDNALPPGTTLKLSNGGFITAYTFEKESPARSTEQWISRVEGSGALKYMTQSHVTNSIAPSVDGTIKFESRCDLSGDYEVVGNADGCSCLQVASGQSISNLTLRVADFSTFDSKAALDHYKILNAPDGYAGKFKLPAGWADDWDVRYTEKGVYVKPRKGMVISIK